MEVDNKKVIASLLSFAYRAEIEEQEVIYYALMEIPPGDDWDTLMKIMRDNEIHKEMLERIAKTLVDEEIEYQPRKFDFSGFDRDTLIKVIAKFEKFAYNFYLYLKRSIRSEEVDEEVIKTLDSLISWERQHINMVEKLLQNLGIRYKIL